MSKKSRKLIQCLDSLSMTKKAKLFDLTYKLLPISKKGRQFIQSFLSSYIDKECLSDDLKLLTYCQCQKSQENQFNALILLSVTKEAILFHRSDEAFVYMIERKAIDSKLLAFLH